MSEDISTQNPNLDKIILRNVVVVAERNGDSFDTKGASNQASQIATENL